MKRILFIHGSADMYGSARILLQMVKLTLSEGNGATVILPHEGMMADALRQLKVEVLIINIGVLRRRYFNPIGMIGRFFLWVYAIVKISLLVNRKSIHYIYINSANVIIGPGLKFFSGKKMIWHLHEIVESPTVLKKFLGFLISRSDVLIAVSEATKTFWGQMVPDKKINLIHNGIDTSPFSSTQKQTIKSEPFFSAKMENKKIVCLIGRVQPWKGQHYFLEIMEKLYDLYPDMNNQLIGIIVGDPYPGYESYGVELESAILKKKLTGKVFYLGFRLDIPEIISSIDLLVVTSTSPDPFPTVVLEAMASSKPVIVTEQGGCLEMVEDNVTGKFIPLDNPVTAAEKLAELLSDESKMLKMGINGYERIHEKFSISSFEKNWISLVLDTP